MLLISTQNVRQTKKNYAKRKSTQNFKVRKTLNINISGYINNIIIEL